MGAHRYQNSEVTRLSVAGRERARQARKGGNPVKHLFVTVLDAVLGCRHRNRSWPRTSLKRGSRGHYQNCLDCGTKLPYHNDELLPESENAA